MEVMVVVLIIGILLSVGIPTYTGARSRGQDRAAQSSLRAGATAAAVVFTDDLDFASANVSGMAMAEPALSYVASPASSTGPNELSITSNPVGTVWAASSLSDSGTCFSIRTDAAGATTFGATDNAPCTGAEALNAAGPSWEDTEGGLASGGFTSDLDIGGYWNTHGNGSVIGGEWEVVAGTVDANITHSNGFNYPVSGQFFDLNGGSAGHVLRAVNVIPNTPYTLTVDVGENVYGGPAVKQMEVIWNGAVVATVDVDVPQHVVESRSFTIPPTASGNGVLEFRSLLGSAHGPTIGNAVLTPNS